MSKKKDGAPKRVKLYIAPDIAERIDASGDDLEARVEAILRAHIEGAKSQGKFADFITELAAPLKDHPLAPQIEKAAKDVAAKVARDVATAAATAAFAAWSAKMAQKTEDEPAAGDASKRPARKSATPETPPKS